LPLDCEGLKETSVTTTRKEQTASICHYVGNIFIIIIIIIVVIVVVVVVVIILILILI